MLRKIALLSAAALVITAPVKAAPLQNATVAQVQSVWADPPSQYGPEPYFNMGGGLDTAVKSLDLAKSLGFHAVTVQWGHGDPDYLTPAYFDFFKSFVASAKARDMRLWIVDDAGYPSGFSGGKFTTDAPELRMQALTVTKVPAAAGAVFDQAVLPETVAVTAIGTDGATVQIPVSDGHVHWTAPDGTWTVSIVTHIFKTSPTRSDTNPTHAKDETQSLEDYLDPAATAKYIAFTHEAYKQAVGDEFGKTILGFRGDEPDFSIPGLPWTPKLFDTFQAKKGYDIRPYLAVLMQGRDAVLTPDQQKAKADYTDVFSQMFAAGFFGPLGDWCAQNGLGYQIHLNHEEMQLQLTRSEGDFLRDMKSLEVPGIDAIWHQIWTDTVSDYPRFASSAAHLYGRQQAFTESFAAFRPQPDITIARYVVNEQAVRGVNLFEMMLLGNGRASGYMRDPAFPALTAYTRRLSYVMSMGRPDAHVAVLLPRAPFFTGDKAADEQFVSTERLLSEHQVDFDIVNEDAVASDLKAVPGGFETVSGNRYRTIVIPMADMLNDQTVARLKAFAAGGGKVLFTGRLPSQITDGAYRNARPVAASDFAWAAFEPSKLDATPTPPDQPPASAPAPLNPPAALVAAVDRAVGGDDLTLKTADTGIHYIHRALKDGSVFLLFNEQANAVDNAVTLHVAGRKVELWDPQTGQVTPVAAKVGKGSVTVPLTMDGYAARLLIVK